MKEAPKPSLMKDAVRAALVSAAMISALGVAWAGAKYHKHVQAAYHAWQWAATKKDSPSLYARLAEIRAPRQARVLAGRMAYRLSSDRRKKRSAARIVLQFGSGEDLYSLVRGDADTRTHLTSGATYYVTPDIDWPTVIFPAPSAQAERLLLEALAGGYDRPSPEITNIVVYDSPPREPTDCSEVETVFAPFRRWDFGSYRVTELGAWSRSIDCQGRPSWHCRGQAPGTVTIERLPGPWRDLPPIPPLPELPKDFDDWKL